ncbi:hypothetical protein AXG93_2651s1200 [Marchantia polymorpha subsp. ruderalis]|uniref:Uncharacterized protein n=1 Tax=Marchantia polymorpha subsp. ruderalis TaxID=1480154 RepID=A0A176WKL9_MARPO|nr:hypothetical protein AXG93_2651s1200 [Marchantia polymorpha subsp. ruderalis]
MHHLARSAQRWAKSLIPPNSSSSAAAAAAGSVAPVFFDLLRGSTRGISSSNFALRAKGAAVFGGGGGGGDDKDGEDEDADEKPKRGKKKMVEISDEDIASEPMDYIFAGVPPDFKAPRLSDEAKEKMWKAYSDSPNDEMIDKLAERFKIRKQRVHAILWLKEIEKKEEAARGSPLEDDIEKAFEQIHGCKQSRKSALDLLNVVLWAPTFVIWGQFSSLDTLSKVRAYDSATNERHYTLPRTMPDFTVQPEGWEGSVKAEGQNIDEVSAKEEKMMVEEFEHRMAFNKLQISGVIKTDKLSRVRPAEGWSYLVEELGEAGKRGRRGGRRFVAQADGSHRGSWGRSKVLVNTISAEAVVDTSATKE